MSYTYLGNTGLQVSKICLGAMMFGGQTDVATAQRIVSKAYDQGVNFIDTADMYHSGESERTVGAAIASRRDDWIVATKVGNPMSDRPNEQGTSRKWIMRAVEASLERIGTDYIDLLYVHRADFKAPLGEMVRAFADLIRQGKVRYFGVSNFKAWRLAETVRLADEAGIDRPAATQPLYNIVNREAEVEHLPAAAHYGVGVVTYSPLARGILTGKYAPGVAPGTDTRAGRADPRMLQAEWREESLDVAQALADYAQHTGTTASALALQWVLANRAVSSVICGPRTEAQWDDYMAKARRAWTSEDEAFIDQLVLPGKTSSLRHLDPHHPVEGRCAG
ncbi:aldo/keto reductase [Paraburkholderia strydomiana]|uniref:aldo/keto reductase n=1 Tax=Paraburkholderia strydomiana TaxID=1245417 RepID=UPI0038B8C639